MVAMLACAGAEAPVTIGGPPNLEPKLNEAYCTDPECSMPSYIDPEDLSATVWWSAATLKGDATMAFYGNYGSVSITASTGSTSSVGHYELNKTELPTFQFYEATTSKLTSKACGQVANGTGDYRAETRLISSGLVLHSEAASVDARPAPQIPCLNNDDGGGGADGGGDGDPSVNWIPYTCYWEDTYINGILVNHEDLGCVFG
jgi:hypothetical protein